MPAAALFRNLRRSMPPSSSLPSSCFTPSSSVNARYPPFHARAVVAIGLAEKLREARFVAARAPIEPDGMERKKGRAEPRVQGQREAGEKDQMPEIHRVARVAIGAADHEALRRIGETGTAAAFARAEVAGQPVLKITPDEERRCPRLQARQ